MSYQSVPRRSLFRNTQPRPQKSAFAPPAPVNAPSRATHPELVQREQAAAAFQRHQFEADGLIVQEKLGVITPSQQERLTVLQAKMDGYRSDRLAHISSIGGAWLDKLSDGVATGTSYQSQQASDISNEIPGKNIGIDINKTSSSDQAHTISRYFTGPG
jgi:hypothetical protein